MHIALMALDANRFSGTRINIDNINNRTELPSHCYSVLMEGAVELFINAVLYTGMATQLIKFIDILSANGSTQ